MKKIIQKNQRKKLKNYLIIWKELVLKKLYMDKILNMTLIIQRMKMMKKIPKIIDLKQWKDLQ